MRNNPKSLGCEAGTEPTSRAWLVALALLALAVGLSGVTAVRPVWAIDPDASLYLGLGRSLAAGEGYVLDGQPHTKYPPGFPALLSVLVVACGPEAYAMFHSALVLGMVAAVLLSFVVARRLGYPPAIAFSVAAAVGLSTTLFDLSVLYLRSEVPFLVATLAALTALWPRRTSTASASLGWPASAAAALATVASIAVRLAGVTLLAIPAIRWLRSTAPQGGRRQAVVVLAAGALALLGWHNWTSRATLAHPGTAAYDAEFFAAEPRDLTKIIRADMPTLDGSSLLHRVAGNAVVMARAMAVLVTNVDRAAARLPVGMLLLLLVLLGLGIMWRAGGARTEAVAYVAATLALYLAWPFNQQERFYVPLLPLLLLACGEGAVALWKACRHLQRSPSGRRLLLGAGGALLLLLALQKSDHPVLLGRWSRSYFALLLTAAVLWIAAGIALRRREWPAPRAWWALALPALVALPALHQRWVDWPARVAEFSARRAADPQPGALARIDADPRLEAVAVYLRDHTPPPTLVMTDVPAMLQILCERRCIPFVYRVQPPDVLTGDAEYVFYSREWPDAAAVTDAVAPRWQTVLELEPVFDGEREVVPTVYRVR